MANYREKPLVRDAIKWMVHGDHPDVIAYHDVDVSGDYVCKSCSIAMSLHGDIDTKGSQGTVTICPTTWIIDCLTTGTFRIFSDNEFSQTWELDV